MPRLLPTLAAPRRMRLAQLWVTNLPMCVDHQARRSFILVSGDRLQLERYGR
jgi:hypothetical protein